MTAAEYRQLLLKYVRYLVVVPGPVGHPPKGLVEWGRGDRPAVPGTGYVYRVRQFDGPGCILTMH